MVERAYAELRSRIDQLARQLASKTGSSSSSSSGSGAVSSVFGRLGAVTAQAGDYTAALVGAAAASHSHAQSEVTGLVSALAGKVDTSDSRLADARTPLAHSHPQSDITSLVSDLAARELKASKNVASGYCGLGADGRVAAAQARSLSLYASANVALAASTTVNVTALDIPVANGDVWTLDYWLPVTVSGGTVGLKPVLTLPSGTTGVITFSGTSTGPTVVPSLTTTTPGTASATAFLTASFTGFIWVRCTLTFTAAGTCRIGVVTGASAAGNLLAGCQVMATKV